ncbi:MAG: hypothetical protein DWQ34_23045 [Planctomycetota bacterium]|nr:MAG: hypothetical protein DWQ29_10050 [Planctomycetota bacterium]REJ88145.1 MAG: hypothetical protein DWQ34_23045 [Planctomycetota bacterium]REK27394.1 MAG: hypothetical protein DWQ41_08535 [Planctomycetota bacterium]REK36583.1 MAG: hypothetical protein DWQ45_08095 [Planctomycetota bacterium]
MHLNEYLPRRVNHGPWLTSYTLNRLRQLDASTEIVLPICSLGAAYSTISTVGDLHLPPLFHEALDDELKHRVVEQIYRCFPEHELSSLRSSKLPRLRVVELSPVTPAECDSPKVLAFSVDTAVEEHGPHLPLCTDTIQSYGVLQQLAREYKGVVPGPPVEYGQLTWGLPFGYSIDLTAELLTRYVTRFTNAVLDWLRPESLYVVDVHGSIVHRQAIVEGLQQSRASRWAFRWLHEPLAEFSSERGDQHAGGVETAFVEYVSPELLDADWWPHRIDDIAAGQMSFERAVELTPDLPRFFQEVADTQCNGIVGKIENYKSLDSRELFDRALDVARSDVESLLSGNPIEQSAGQQLW